MPTIADLMELAIQAERSSQNFYNDLAELFNKHPDVMVFWQNYAKEEAGHARWIENLRERASTEKMSAPVDIAMWNNAVRTTSQPHTEYVAGIQTLQDAWETANELEHGETNVIFEFLIAHFTTDEQALAFLRSQLRDHLGHLMTEFPTSYQDSTVRQSVMAVRGQS